MSKSNRFRKLAQNLSAEGKLVTSGLAPTVSLGAIDSAQVLGLIDSAYIQARQIDTFRDSAFVTDIVTSAYIQLRQTDISRDSAFVTGIVDSAYVAARTSGGGGAVNGYGDSYATYYTALTSGTKTSITGTGVTEYTLDTDIDNASDGDILVLEPGTYLINCTTANNDTYVSTLFRNKEIAIVGNGTDPKDVVLTVDHNTARDKAIFPGNTTGKCHLANMRLIRNDTSTTNYVSALVRGNNGDGSGYMRNVIFDNNNGGISWVYDNGNSSTNRARFNNCSFVNYGTWYSKYSGSTSHVQVNNCAFDDTYNTNDATFGTGADANQASVTFDADYDYTGSSDYGHKANRTFSSSDISISST